MPLKSFIRTVSIKVSVLSLHHRNHSIYPLICFFLLFTLISLETPQDYMVQTPPHTTLTIALGTRFLSKRTEP